VTALLLVIIILASKAYFYSLVSSHVAVFYLSILALALCSRFSMSGAPRAYIALFVLTFWFSSWLSLHAVLSPSGVEWLLNI
jgi:hypothetical protein